MTFMFVANASLQRHEFIWRMMGQTKERRLTIQPMSQVRLVDDLQPEDVAHIIEQHEKYGFLSVDDVRRGAVKKKKFTRLCYSMGSFIPSTTIETLFRTNMTALDDQGKDLRQETAIASNNAVIRELDSQRQQSNLEGEVRNFELTIQEETNGTDDTADVVAEGYRVNAREQQSQPSRRKGR